MTSVDQCDIDTENSSPFLSKFFREPFMDFKVPFAHSRPLSSKNLIKICFCYRRWKDLHGINKQEQINMKMFKQWQSFYNHTFEIVPLTINGIPSHMDATYTLYIRNWMSY